MDAFTDDDRHNDDTTPAGPPDQVEPVGSLIVMATAGSDDEDHATPDGGPGSEPAPDPVRCGFDDEWRRWVAENLVLGASRESVVATLVEHGFPAALAAAEVDRALRSPYLRGAERLRNRLKKRDWVLACYRKLQRLRPSCGRVDRRDRLPRAAFLAEYYSANRPVLITGMMDDWPARTRWSLDHFEARFGDREVEVQVGRSAGADYEVASRKYAHTMRFGDFVNRVRAAGVSNDLYLTANNNSRNKSALPELWDDVVPLPEYLDGGDPLAGFFWLGPAGTVTPFHHDLTNNFMAQVLGRKRVLLVPSWDLPLMGNLQHVYSTVDGRSLSATPSPRFEEPQVLECVLGPGEILFLPIGWMHHVEALDVSATVSFTNFVFDNDFHSFYATYHGV